MLHGPNKNFSVRNIEIAPAKTANFTEAPTGKNGKYAYGDDGDLLPFVREHRIKDNVNLAKRSAPISCLGTCQYLVMPKNFHGTNDNIVWNILVAFGSPLREEESMVI